MKLTFFLFLFSSLSLSAQTPLPGLPGNLNQTFRLGLEDFNGIETIEDGLGPAFNAPGCGACHNIPVAGGGGNFTVLRAGRRVGNSFTEPAGGSLIHVAATDSRCQPRVPANANVLARRLSTPLFGAGLVEAIPDETLRNLEEQQRRMPDFIRGRAAIIRDPAANTIRVGRFGWKAQLATLLAFAGDAYVNEMGITNDIFPNEVGAGLTPEQLAACDTVPGVEDHRDPATGHRGIDLFAHFMRYLSPVEPLPATTQTRRGEAMFAAIGCATCHVPLLMTGANPVAALDRKPVRAYSDFLLHSIGTGDGIEQGAARGDEMRTAPLWGLRYRKMLLHDGRALSIDDAIDEHGMEALPSRIRYRGLPPADRAALLAFLGGL